MAGEASVTQRGAPSGTGEARLLLPTTADSSDGGAAVAATNIGGMQARHKLVLLCGASSFICYADRVNISVAILHMGLSNLAAGAVLASFFYGYFTTQILGGILANRYGGRRVLNVAVAWWSACTVATPWATRQGLPTLLACRVAMGAGEGLAFPALYDLISRWAPPLERARSFGVVQLGVKAGTTLALALGPAVIRAAGWEALFYSFGSMGFLWNAAWMTLTVEQPPVDYHRAGATGAKEEEPGGEDGEATRGGAGAALGALTPGLARQLLGTPAVWALVAGHFAYAWGHYLLLAWLPTYLHQVHGVAKDDMALACIPFLAMAVAVGWWAVLADAWATKASLTTVRKGMTTIGLGGAAVLMLLTPLARSATSAILLVSASLAVQAAAGSGAVINHADLAPRQASVLLSLSNTFATLPGMVAVPLASAIVETRWGSWEHVFALASAVLFAGLLIYRRYASAEPLILRA